MTALRIPAGYVGPVTLPTGREVYWTGKIAIGIEHKRQQQPVGESAELVQALFAEPKEKA